MTTADSMYERTYFEIQAVLDEVLGTEDEGAAGNGIVADVRLALQRAEQKGHRAGREAAARDIEATGNYERQARIAREGLRPDEAKCETCDGTRISAYYNVRKGGVVPGPCPDCPAGTEAAK